MTRLLRIAQSGCLIGLRAARTEDGVARVMTVPSILVSLASWSLRLRATYYVLPSWDGVLGLHWWWLGLGRAALGWGR